MIYNMGVLVVSVVWLVVVMPICVKVDNDGNILVVFLCNKSTRVYCLA